MNKMGFSLFAAMSAAAVLAAGPVVDQDEVTMTQDTSGKVVVTYTLRGEAGVITLGIETNSPSGWLPLGDECVRHLSGDVNRKVTQLDVAHKIFWHPRKDFPNQEISGGNIRAVVKAWSTKAPPPVMVLDLTIAGDVQYFPSLKALPGGVQDRQYKTDRMVLVKCPAAGVRWRMGSPSTEPGRHWDAPNREVLHAVTLSDDFYIGVYEVTQKQYFDMMGEAKANFKGEGWEQRPMEKVSYAQIRGNGATAGAGWPTYDDVDSGSFLHTLRQHVGGGDFDLPLDAQWEFACRAGCGTGLNNGTELSSVDNLAVVARCHVNSDAANATADCGPDKGTAIVGTYAPNAWGIYDMHGNVWEWCRDWYVKNLAEVDPDKGPDSGTTHPRRGNGWNSAADYALSRCAARSDLSGGTTQSDLGFRIVCTAVCP